MKKIPAITLVLIGYAIAASQFSARASVRLAQADSIAIDVKQGRQGSDNPLIWVQRPSLKNDPASGVGGGHSGDKNRCTAVRERLTALVPMKDEQSTLMQTAQTNPTFWFYIPYSAKLPAEFVLRNPQDTPDKPFYATPLVLPGKQGIVGIKLPSTKLLKLGVYRWKLQVRCDSRNPAADVYVNGAIERVQPSANLIPPPKTAAEKRAILYAKDGLWSETLTTLLKEVRPKQPQVGTKMLTKLLGEYGLGNLAQQPIVLEQVDAAGKLPNQSPTRIKGAQW